MLCRDAPGICSPTLRWRCGALKEPLVSQPMKALIDSLMAKADLSDVQAEKVASVVKEFLDDKLPDAVQGPVTAALTGDNVEAALDQAKGMLGKLF